MNEGVARYLLFSIDTESDALHWKGCSPDNLTFKSCEGLPVLMDIVGGFGVRPTFLITHAMASQRQVVSCIEPMLKNNLCEVGAHFHPGDTPPYERSDGIIRDNILTVPDGLLDTKFNELYSLLSSRFGPPRSFRCGAWTIDSRVIKLLEHYGVTVDSSVTPHVSWRLINRPSYLTAPDKAYFLDRLDPSMPGDSAILEIPVSIWSSKQADGLIGEIIAAAFSMPLESQSGYFARIIKAIRSDKPVWIRPALFSAAEMISAAMELKEKVDYVHIMCHSNELAVGTSPYSKTPEQLKRLLTRLRMFFSFAREQGYIPMTLSEYAAIEIQHRADNPQTIVHQSLENNPKHVETDLFTQKSAVITTNEKTKKPVLLVIKWSVSLGILVFIVLHADFLSLWEKLRAINVFFAIIAVVLTVLTNYLNGWKISLILNSPRESIARLTNINFISAFFSNVLPTRFGGDIIRIVYISKDLSSKELGAFAVVFDRITGILVQILFVLFSCALFSMKHTDLRIKCLCAFAGTMILLSVIIYKGQGLRFFLVFLDKIIDKTSLLVLIKELFKNRKRYFSIFFAGGIFQLFVVIIIIILTAAFGGKISFFEASVVLFASTMACFLPLSIGGIGVMEGVFIYLYQILYARGEIGLAVSLGLRITSIIPSLLGGIVFLRRNKSLVKKN